MDKNNRVLVAVILLIFVTLLSFNVDTITGSSTKDNKNPSVSVSPKVIELGTRGLGTRLTVTVRSGEKGVNEKAVLRDAEGFKKADMHNACEKYNNYKCYSEKGNLIQFAFAPSNSLKEGVYQVCVHDYKLAEDKKDQGDHSANRGQVCGDFTIIREEIEKELTG